jgi:hypothetical protein
MKKYAWIVGIVALLWIQPAFSATISWTDWMAAQEGANGTAEGQITQSNGNVVDVVYTGDIRFAQLGTGTNYWTEGDPAPYTGNPVVDNAPTPSELIALSGSGIENTITFSEMVTDPIMAIVSLGRPKLPVSYDFDQPFTVLGEGRGYWGDGSYSLSGGDVLTGNELHSVIQFEGTLSSISWTADPGEYWHGITVGTEPVPEPGTIFLMAAGVLGLGVFRKMKK